LPDHPTTRYGQCTANKNQLWNVSMACGEIISEEGSNNKVLLTLEENGKMIIKYNYLSISDNPSLHCETIEKFGPQINKLTFGYVAEQHQDSGYASIDKLLQCFINLTQLTLAPTSFVQFDKTLKHKHPSSTSEDLSFINCTMHKKDTFPYLSTKYLLIDTLFLHNCDFKDKEEEGRAAAADYTSLHINMPLTSITTLKVAHPYFRNLGKCA
jgi:hypothetical protein